MNVSSVCTERVCWCPRWWWLCGSLWFKTRMACFNGYGRIDLSKTHNPGTITPSFKFSIWLEQKYCENNHVNILMTKSRAQLHTLEIANKLFRMLKIFTALVYIHFCVLCLFLTSWDLASHLNDKLWHQIVDGFLLLEVSLDWIWMTNIS